MARIAVVENESLVALDLVRTLEQAGHEVLGPFEDAASFFDAIAPLPDAALPALALLDISLPGDTDGIGIAEALAARGRTGSVFLTAHEEETVLDRAKKVRPLGFIVKPFGQRELLRTIDMALYRWTMDRRLMESEVRYRNLFERGIAARFVCDRLGKITDRNPAFDGLFGARAADIAGMLPDSAWEGILRTFDAGGRYGPAEHAFTLFDGSIRRVLLSLSLLSPDASDAPDISGEVVDQTEEAVLRESVAQSSKMEAMGRLASGVAHDFNNVLTAIMGHATLMKNDLPADSKAREDLEGVLAASARASDITRQLLGFSRKRSYAPQSVDPRESLRNSERMLRRLAGERVAFSCECDARVPRVMADPTQMEQVFLNLVMNSRDALEGQANARILARVLPARLDAERRIGTTVLPEGDYAIIEVADNGRGMAPAVASRMFEPFFTTKGEGRGTGLGLSILHDMAENSNGAIAVETGEGQGTTISLWLPALADAVPPHATEIRGTDSAASPESGDAGETARLPEGLRILLVEDDGIVLSSLSRAFERAGAEVVAVHNPGEAVLAAERAPCELLVTDLVMPFMDGFELAGRLLGTGRASKVLYMTGKPDLDLSRADGWPLLEKPFSAERLIAAAREALRAR